MAVFEAGNVAVNAAVQIPFSTFNAAGASANRTTAGAVRIYKDGSTTERTSVSGIVDNGVTGYDSVTGANLVTIDLSDNTDAGFYVAGHNYHVQINGAVIDGQMVNAWVGDFSIDNRLATADVTKWNGTAVSSPATAGIPDVNVKNINNVAASSVTTVNANVGTTQPVNFTGTAGSALIKGDTVDIAGTASAGTAGYVGLDWAHITAPTTAVDLSGTTIKNVDNAIASVTTVTGNVGGNVTGSVGSVATDVGITQAGADKVWNTASRTLTSFGTLVADVTTAVWAAGARTLTAFGFSVTVGTNSDKTGYTLSTGGVQAIWDALTANLTTANSIGKRLVDFVTTLVYSAPPSAADNADAVWDELMAGHVIVGSAGADLTTAASGGSVPTVQQIVDGVWDEAIAGHLSAGSTGEALSNAGGGGGGDPWATVVPDGYAQGTAGYNQGLIPTIEAQTSLITAENVKVVNLVNLITLELTLYNSMDYSTSSGTALPTWTSDDWTAYGLQTAASVTLYYADVNSDTDTALGSIVVDSATSIHFEAARSAVMALTLGEAIAGYKIIAVLDHAHGDSEVVLVNAALSHLNYSLYRNLSKPNTAA